jgi:hypothetical protein
MLVPPSIKVIEIDLKFRAKVSEKLNRVVSIHSKVLIQTRAYRKPFSFYSEVTSQEALNAAFKHFWLWFDCHSKQRSVAPSPQLLITGDYTF